LNKKIVSIDFLKGYSILTIVIYHIGQTLHLPAIWERMINFGGTGVHTFIFLSGFGLYLSHLNRPLSFVAFLKKRFTKIYIPYITVVALSALTALFIPIYKSSLYALLGHLFLYKMFDNNIIGSYGYQLWFISTIIQLYLLFPVLVRMKRMMKDRLFLLTGLLISMGWPLLVYMLGKSGVRAWDSFFLQYIWEFMLGMVCAEKFANNGYAFWAQPIGSLGLIAVAGLGLYSLMAIQMGVVGHVLNDVPGLLGYTALGLLIYSFHCLPINRFVLFTSKISYPLFLVHILILRILEWTSAHFAIPFHGPMAVLTFISCYLVAVLLQAIFKRLLIL
jgi:peptidoglycan/LPS O-acetylase OafA/YrhL